MDEFDKQVKSSMQNTIYEFNNNSQYSEIRQLYRNNFDKIVIFIKQSNSKSAIEDISLLDKNLTAIVNAKFRLLTEINKAIGQQELTLSKIK